MEEPYLRAAGTLHQPRTVSRLYPSLRHQPDQVKDWAPEAKPSTDLYGSIPPPSPPRALASFETNHLAICQERLDALTNGKREPEVYPLWDPEQLLRTSQVLLLKAACVPTNDECGSDDASSVTSGDGDHSTKYVQLCVNRVSAVVCGSCA